MKASSQHLWVLSVLVAAAALGPGVCKADDTTQSTPESADPYPGCIRKLAADPEFAELSKKLPLFGMTTIAFAMLADNNAKNFSPGLISAINAGKMASHC